MNLVQGSYPSLALVSSRIANRSFIVSARSMAMRVCRKSGIPLKIGVDRSRGQVCPSDLCELTHGFSGVRRKVFSSVREKYSRKKDPSLPLLLPLGLIGFQAKEGEMDGN